jgi:hypothetical protein
MPDKRIKRIKAIYPNEFDDNFINHFCTEWENTRKAVKMELGKYEKLYQENKDFKEYVDRYMRNKEDAKLKDVLRMKQIQLVGDMYKSEGK